MGIFDNFKHKTLTFISEVSDKVNNSVNSQLKKEADNSFDSLNIIYYRYYSNYKVYRAVFFKKDTNMVSNESFEEEFSTLEELKSFFSKYNLKVRFENALSKDYIYLTRSGINTDGSDLRLEKDIVIDSSFYCMLSNSVLDSVNLVTDKLTFDLYNPSIMDTSKLNRNKWSVEIIEQYLYKGRMVALLTSDEKIQYNENSGLIVTYPKELLFDLSALSKTNQLHMTHCGDLGIQLSFR